MPNYRIVTRVQCSRYLAFYQHIVQKECHICIANLAICVYASFYWLKGGFQPYRHNAMHVMHATNATYARSGQQHGWNLSRDMACIKLELSILLRDMVWTWRCLHNACVKPCVSCVACIRLETVLKVHFCCTGAIIIVKRNVFMGVDCFSSDR